jgi:membrane protein YdbS with pleckstrin-like domain
VFDLFKRLVLRVAAVPAEPRAPSGSPGSIRVFRAGASYWNYLLVMWGLRHAVGAFVIVAFLTATGAWKVANAQFPEVMIPGLVHALEIAALAFFLIQMPFSLASSRLNYEMRWYIVTDRSLRIREGIFGVREMTLTFANVQNISIRQGPLQRLLGIADVVVRTAGGGSSGAHSHGGEGGAGIGASMHTGTLRAVDNAEQVRDLILDRLRRFRDAGLGDPDDAQAHAPTPGALDAARELLAETRALRRSLAE